jgi:uncharacterized protein (DUF433 family)
MRLEDHFVTIAPNDIRIKGTRLGIETVLHDFIHRGDAPDAIAARYPSLTLEQVYATITFYLHEPDRIGAYLTEWLDHGRRVREAQEQDLPPVMRKLRRWISSAGPLSRTSIGTACTIFP